MTSASIHGLGATPTLDEMRELIAEGANKGYGEYRTHLMYMDRVAGTYSWGDGALGRFNETLKDALEPNGILSPGRNGIWGRRWRENGWKSGRLGDRAPI